MPSITLANLNKNYGAFHAVRGIDLEVADGEFIVLVGPSGCGKSTTLRMLAGLESVTSGDILIGERRVNGISPKDRNVAMVFQSYALYPHMTVFDNMAFGLKLRGVPRETRESQIAKTASVLGLSDMLVRKPRELSGGQRQRVAMGRAIVRDPQAFLFDEPLSNLDAKLRVGMRAEIKRLHRELKTTTVYVTHDQVEAMTLADRIVVMNNGIIEQVGSPQNLYDAPQSRFVASFIGSPAMNFIEGELNETSDGLSILIEGGTSLKLPQALTRRCGVLSSRQVVLGIRPEHISLTDENSEPVEAELNLVEPLGMDTLIYFRVGSLEDCCARVSPKHLNQTEGPIKLRFDMNEAHLFDPKTDRAI